LGATADFSSESGPAGGVGEVGDEDEKERGQDREPCGEGMNCWRVMLGLVLDETKESQAGGFEGIPDAFLVLIDERSSPLLWKILSKLIVPVPVNLSFCCGDLIVPVPVNFVPGMWSAEKT
jgi:hypothetical protein